MRLWAATLAFAAATSAAHASERSSSAGAASSAGPAGSVGLGAQYGGFGLQLAYHQPITRHPFTLFGGLGYGAHSMFEGTGTYDGQHRWVFGASATAGVSYGHRHRVSAAFGYAIATAQAIVIEGLIVDAVGRYGAFAELGYDLVGKSGVLLRILPVGVTYVPHPLVAPGDRWAYTFSLGVGWKPW